MRKNNESHIERVQKVQEQVLKSDKTKKLCTSRPSWQTMNVSGATYKQGSMNQINLLPLCEIVEVDTKKAIVRCEPNVTCGQITACLNPIGWTLKVLPELDDLTVGGLTAGSGIETSSHKYGLFQHTVVGYEVVLADGSLVTCNENENKELFDALPWSYGTLGFIVCVDLQIIPAKKYVHLRYLPCKDLKECQEVLLKESGGEHEFIEALVYSDKRAVVMVGDMTDQADFWKVNSIGYFWKEWFYSHVQHYCDKKGEEFIPLRHYYHRHTKSIFWEMEDILPFGNHWLFRYTLGWLIPPKIAFLKLTQTKELHDLYKNHHVIQDMLVPLKLFEKSVGIFDQEWTVYPLWVCPTVIPKTTKGFVSNKSDTEMFVDIGAYGTPKVKGFDIVKSSRNVEKYVRDVKGFQLLYADTYMERDEFNEMFDTELYEKLRKKYKCEIVFPDVFEKVCIKSRD